MYCLTAIIAIAAVASVIASVILSVFTWKKSKKSLSHQIIHNLLMEYRTVHMLAAIQRLYDLKDFCTEKHKYIKSMYEIEVREEKAEYEELKGNDRINYLATSINHQRRLVSHFYYLLKHAIESKMVYEKDVFTFWKSGDLSIIPEILIPIGLDDDKELMDLYNRAIDFEKKRGGQPIDK